MRSWGEGMMRKTVLVCLLYTVAIATVVWADWSTESTTAIVDSCRPRFSSWEREVYLLCVGNGATTVTVSSPALSNDIVFTLPDPFGSHWEFLERKTFDQSSYVIEDKPPGNPGTGGVPPSGARGRQDADGSGGTSGCQGRKGQLEYKIPGAEEG